MGLKTIKSKQVLACLFWVLASVSSRAQETADAGLIEKYRSKTKTDSKNSQVWAFCAAVAFAKENYSDEKFRDYTKTIVATLKKMVTDSTVCPCEDVIPAELWDEKTAVKKSSGSKEVKNQIAKRPVQKDGEIPAEDVTKPKMAAATTSSPAKSVAGSQGVQKTGIKKRVQAINIPDFQAGKSGLLADGLIGTYRGICLSFIPDIEVSSPSYGDPSGIKVSTHVYKLTGSDWYKSTHDRPLLSFFPATRTNEKAEELSYYWTGPMTVKEAMENVQRANPDATASKYGLFNKNNSTPPLDYKSPASFTKLVSDLSERPSLWAIGPPPYFSNAGEASLDVTATTLYISNWRVTREEDYLFDHYDISRIIPDPVEVHMAPSDKKGDAGVWIGSGQKIIRADHGGELKVTDLAAYDAHGSISKMRCKQGVLWVLCGSDIFKMQEGRLSKFYTITSPMPSFAVDHNYVFTNDGHKISIAFKTKESLLGDESLMAADKSSYDQLKMILGACSLEATDDPTDRFLYVLSTADGKIYKVEK